jgi:hypothetical protein
MCYSMYVIFEATRTDFERPVNTSFEDSIHMPQNYHNRDRSQVPTSCNKSPSISASSENPTLQTWEDAISAYGWDVPRNVRRGRNRPTSTLDDVVERGNSRRDGALRLEREGQTKLERVVRREEALARFDGGGDLSADAVSSSQIQRPGSVRQVPLAANRGVRSHAFNIPRETHSPILQRVRNIHANRRNETLAAVRKGRSDTESKHARVDDVSDDEELFKLQTKKIEVRKGEVAKSSPPLTPESIPDMKDEAKKCDNIAESTGEMWMSRNIKASSRELPDYKAVKSHEKPRGVHTETRMSNGSILSDSSEGEDDSVHYSSEDDFERLEMPTNSESEHNGAKRKWYKGYRL